MENLFIARQPIYDDRLKVIGYELLYRNGNVDHAVFDDGDLASCDTILNTFMHIGIDNIAGSAPVFINLPTEFILDPSLTPMFREQCVLEILEHVEPTPEIIESLKRLKQEGYRIALDDFSFEESRIPFLQLADYVKIDVIANDTEQIRALLDIISDYPAKVVAEKVETQDMYSQCRQLGFRYYQGFFFCKPQLVQQKHIPASKAVVLELLNRTQDPALDYGELERILAQDVGLSYKLLRYINSAMFSLRSEVESIRDAVVLLGLNNMRQWLSLILMSKMTDSKPDELIVTALIRGKMCQSLAHRLHPEIESQMFIVGLFSILDALMDRPMVDLLDTVILSTPIKMALLDRSGDHGKIYQMVLDYEHFRWHRLPGTELSGEELVRYYLDAVEWADSSIGSLY